MRKKLTNSEWNVLMKYIRRLGLDGVFDLHEIDKDTDGFIDYEEDRIVDLQEGLSWVWESIVYPTSHEGMSLEETEILSKIFNECYLLDEVTLTWR